MVGCYACRQGSASFQSQQQFDESDCASSFRPIDSYFSASLKRCRTCSTVWLVGYHEDFTDVDVADEWGKRIFITRPLGPDYVARIAAAEGTAALDIDTFAI